MALGAMGGLGALAAKAAEKTQAVETEIDHAAEALVGKVSYACRPMTNYSIGRYTFDNGVMHLTPEEAADFDKLWEGQPAYLKHHVVKVDQAAAEARLAEILANKGKVQSGVTTTEHNPLPNADGKVDPASADAKTTI